MTQPKPTYLGLLNAISNGESEAAHYFAAWKALSTNESVREVLGVVINREAEHGLAFEKRLIEMGYTLRPRPTEEARTKLAYLSDAAHSDLDRLLFLGYGEDRDDPFVRFMDDRTMDPQTGALMGRYICEERDTIRRLRSLTDRLRAA